MTGPTNNLAGVPIAEDMISGVHIAANDRMGYLDGAITNPLDVPVVATNIVSLNALQFATNASFILTENGVDAAITLRVPELNADGNPMYRGNFNVFNRTAFQATVTKDGGQVLDAPVIPAGHSATLHFDGVNVEFYTKPTGASTPLDRGIVSAAITPEPVDGLMQIAENGGAHDLNAPTGTGTFVLTYINGAAAGIITPVGWDVVTDPSLALSHTVQNSIVRLTAYNDGLASELIVALVVDATP